MADHQIEGGCRAIFLEAPAYPAMPPGQVLADLQPDIGGAWEETPHRLAHVAKAAAGIEDTGDLEAEVGRVGANEVSQAQLLGACRHARRGIAVVAAVEIGVEPQALRSWGHRRHHPMARPRPAAGWRPSPRTSAR